MTHSIIHEASVAGRYVINSGDKVVTSTTDVVLASKAVPATAGNTVTIVAKADALNGARPAFLTLLIDGVVQDSDQTPVGVKGRSTLVAAHNFVASSSKSYRVEIRGRFNTGNGGRFIQPKLIIVWYR